MKHYIAFIFPWVWFVWEPVAHLEDLPLVQAISEVTAGRLQPGLFMWKPFQRNSLLTEALFWCWDHGELAGVKKVLISPKYKGEFDILMGNTTHDLDLQIFTKFKILKEVFL